MSYRDPSWGDANVVVIASKDYQGVIRPVFQGGSQYSGGFAMPVFPTGDAGTGVPYGDILIPKTKANSNVNDTTQYQTDATGATLLQFFIGGVTQTTTAFLVIGLSDQLNDQTNVKANVDSFIDTSTGYIVAPVGTSVAKTFAVPVNPYFPFWEIKADFATPWKTWGVGLSTDVPGIKIGLAKVRSA